MTLEEYLNAGSTGIPENDTKGTPSQWMPVTSLTVLNGSLWAGDPCVCDADDGCTIDLPNGRYLVEAQGFDFDGIRVIGRARARCASASRVSLGDVVGETGTDSAMIAICDMGSIDAAVADDDDGFQAVIDQYDFQRFGLLQFKMQGDINIAYVNSGFGDGTSPMYKLIAGDECVGLELDFICTDRA